MLLEVFQPVLLCVRSFLSLLVSPAGRVKQFGGEGRGGREELYRSGLCGLEEYLESLRTGLVCRLFRLAFLCSLDVVNYTPISLAV